MVQLNEKLRFWLPIVALFAFAIYTGQKLIRAHLYPDAQTPRYDFEYKVAARRGSIYGAYGKDSPLAKSVPYWEYHLDPVALTNAVVVPRLERGKRSDPRSKLAIVRTIADALKLDYEKVKEMSDKTSNRYQPLALSSDPDAHRVLADSSLVAGVAIEDKQVRQYLNGRSLSHVIGAVNAKGSGSCGLEQYFDKELTGVPGVVKGKKDARGRELYDKRELSIDPTPGADIYLTIEPNIQHETEEHLKWGMNEFGAASGCAIVMDAKTGAIQAMASYPDFSPLAFGKATEDEKVNRAVAFNYEPGSVMKVITVATAIDSNPHKYGPNTLYRTNRDDRNYYKLPGDGSHVWDPTMTLTHAIVHSSNIVIGKLAYDVGPITLHEYFRRFGFGEKTGIELPGEQFGILPDPNKKMWDLASRSRAGIGQFVAVTPIQLIGAYQAIANDGIRMKPYIVEKVVGADGKTLKTGEPTIVGHPITAKTAETVREMMVGVATREGTARRAAIKGYSIAGKTGTAQKADRGKYLPGLYRATFCGMIPADEPKIVVLVMLDFEQKATYHQGGNSAAPVFKRVALSSIRYLGIEPDRPEELEEAEGPDEYEKMLNENL